MPRTEKQRTTSLRTAIRTGSRIAFDTPVTPSTFSEATEGYDAPEPISPTSAKSNKQPQKADGHIPRPPNAFMLFRSEMCRRDPSNSIVYMNDDNSQSLSQIIASHWHSLPVDEKEVWHAQADKLKAEHQMKHPEYQYRPVHKKRKGDKQQSNKQKEVEALAPTVSEGESRHLNRRSLSVVPAAKRLLKHKEEPGLGSDPTFDLLRLSSAPLPDQSRPKITLPQVPAIIIQPSSPLMQTDRVSYGKYRPANTGPSVASVSWGLPVESTPLLTRDDLFPPEIKISHLERDVPNSKMPPTRFDGTQPLTMDPQAPSSHNVQDAVGPMDKLLYLQAYLNDQQQLRDGNSLVSGLDLMQDLRPFSPANTSTSSLSSTTTEASFPVSTGLPVLRSPRPQPAAMASVFQDLDQWKPHDSGLCSNNHVQSSQPHPINRRIHAPAAPWILSVPRPDIWPDPRSTSTSYSGSPPPSSAGGLSASSNMWLDPRSNPSTAYSGSPAYSDTGSLPVTSFPSSDSTSRPQSTAPIIDSDAFENLDFWKDLDISAFADGPGAEEGFGIGWDPRTTLSVDDEGLDSEFWKALGYSDGPWHLPGP
ncbi:hypothetical protein DXG01_001760 [Tephrocybe rancida]|nr:hypothetical protein DXG01_001760 [Tephrocybe rancida]